MPAPLLTSSFRLEPSLVSSQIERLAVSKRPSSRLPVTVAATSRPSGEHAAAYQLWRVSCEIRCGEQPVLDLDRTSTSRRNCPERQPVRGDRRRTERIGLEEDPAAVRGPALTQRRTDAAKR